MEKKKRVKELISPSVELQVLHNTKVNANTDYQSSLETASVREIVCPKCQSRSCWKQKKLDEYRHEYRCKDCKKYFTVNPLFDEKGREIICPDCSSRDYTNIKDYKGIPRYRCRHCKRKYVIDPLAPNDIKLLNNVNCHWCGSKNFRRICLDTKGRQRCDCRDCGRSFTVGAKRLPSMLNPPDQFDFNHDIWTTDHLGYERGIHKHYKLNFSYIAQPWLKYFFKKYILYISSTRLSFSTLIGKVTEIRTFSRFLSEIKYNEEFEGINRSLIIQYLAYLKINKYSDSTYLHCIGTLKTFFETGILNFWFQVEPALK